jgi:hypothetical protein
VGGLLGYGNAANYVNSTANVTGNTFTGGVTGQQGGSISNANWTGASISAGHQSGGLVGQIGGTIDNSFATGNIKHQGISGWA